MGFDDVIRQTVREVVREELRAALAEVRPASPTRLGQGRENTKEFLRQNPDLSEEIELAVRQRATGGEIPMPMTVGGGSEDGGEDSGDEA